MIRSRRYDQEHQGGRPCKGLGEESMSCNEQVCTTTTMKPITLNNEQKGGLLLFILLVICLSPLGIGCWVLCLCACGIYLYQRSQQKNLGSRNGGEEGYEDWDGG